MQPKTITYLLGAVLLFGVFYHAIISPPPAFPKGRTVAVEKGWSLGKISSVLKENHIIRSKAAFEFFVIIAGGEKRIKPSYYLFEKELPVFRVAWLMSGGKFYMAPVRVTIPEGYTVAEIADAFEAKLPDFNRDRFLSMAAAQEGYLFPDTYFFLITENEDDVFAAMTENFEKKLSSLRGEITESGKKEQDIVVMASIIEGEANGDEDRTLISGILWKRLDIGMPLQADAAPITYKEKGLPEHPVSNPGMKALRAAIHPESSPYLYYLHDPEGAIHYAKSFAEHVANKAKYLK